MRGQIDKQKRGVRKNDLNLFFAGLGIGSHGPDPEKLGFLKLGFFKGKRRIPISIWLPI